MKLKTILTFAVAASFAAGVISCEDMLKVDSKTVMFDSQHQLDEATDTTYSILGIIKQMQKIADRSVILGEVRGDLVELTDHATDDLREIYSFDFQNVKKTNKYDQALDYYAIINNCNYYLNNVDLDYKRNEEYVFRKEYVVVLCYRAWAYLQLAQAYGEVPFFDKPITGDVSLASGNKLNIKELALTLLADFKDEYMDYELPNYGDLQGETTGSGTTPSSHKSTELFIPVRLIMGDLYLWAEDYANAALCYHGFLTNRRKTYPTGTNGILWKSNDFLSVNGFSASYTNLFSDGNYLCYIPMEADEYSGVVSDLPNIFNSTDDNYNWYQMTYSRGATALSTRQTYCYHCRYSSVNPRQWAEYMNKDDEEVILYRGDLRLNEVFTHRTKELTIEQLNTGRYSTETQTLNKINSEKIWLYRKDVVYLRLAEALNRCGLPQTAFAILKTGLCNESIDSLRMQGLLTHEMERARNIDGVDISSVYSFPTQYFTRATATWATTNLGEGSTAAKAMYEVFSWGPVMNVGNTIGIHSRGCGDAGYDPNYRIPVDTTAAVITLTDSIRAVEEALIDEMGLETCFEGYRFGDMMRIAMHRAADEGHPGYGGFAENEFLAKRVAVREDATLDETQDRYSVMDDALYQKLLGADGKSLNKNWFLVLPDEK